MHINDEYSLSAVLPTAFSWLQFGIWEQNTQEAFSLPVVM